MTAERNVESASLERRIRISPEVLGEITAPGYKSPPVTVSAIDDGTYLELIFETHRCDDEHQIDTPGSDR